MTYKFLGTMVDKQDILELYRKCAAELPPDIISALKKSLKNEKSPAAKDNLKIILENTFMAKKESKPICQDTGTPFFYVELPTEYSMGNIRQIIEAATIEATEQIPLRPNALEAISGKPLGNKPMIHFEQADKLKIELLMKGGGSENVSVIYSLPNQALKANRNIDGIRKSVLDAVFKALGVD